MFWTLLKLRMCRTNKWGAKHPYLQKSPERVHKGQLSTLAHTHTHCRTLSNLANALYRNSMSSSSSWSIAYPPLEGLVTGFALPATRGTRLTKLCTTMASSHSLICSPESNSGRGGVLDPEYLYRGSHAAQPAWFSLWDSMACICYGTQTPYNFLSLR